jgi:hypothetical protein
MWSVLSGSLGSAAITTTLVCARATGMHFFGCDVCCVMDGEFFDAVFSFVRQHKIDTDTFV